LYNYIPLEKEIEGHKHKSPFLPALGLATLTALKYVFSDQKISPELFVSIPKDTSSIKAFLRNKKVIIVGRGTTGGQPIGKVFNALKINYLSIGAQTDEPEEYFKDADIIISAVGKNVLSPEMLKPGVILLSAGLRRENGKLKGDYDGELVKNISSFYTPTPGGIGPLDVVYLFKNLIEATKMQ
jgi:methylenetetrahydrofolate dehydrogenase (NADP+)/methenyltetrahydrofolate cyclohydrolase